MATSAESSLQASDSSPIPRALLAEQKMQTQLSQGLGLSTRSPLGCAASPFAARLLEPDPLPSSPGLEQNPRGRNPAAHSPPAIAQPSCYRTAISHHAGTSIRNTAPTPPKNHSEHPRQLPPPSVPWYFPSGLLAAPSRCAGLLQAAQQLLHPLQELLSNCCCFCLI